MHSMGYTLPEPKRDYQWTGGRDADRMHCELTGVEYSNSDCDDDKDETRRWPRAPKEEVFEKDRKKEVEAVEGDFEITVR